MRHFQASVACQLLDRSNIAESGVFHDEADRRAMCATTEAMIELLGLADRKRGGFFVVEWTAGDKIRAGLLERHVALDHIHDIETIEQVLNETFWNQVSTLFIPPVCGQWNR